MLSWGVPLDDAWDHTLPEVETIFGGIYRRRIREYNDRAWLAWHTAALPNMKRMPSLRDLLHKEKPLRRQTWEEQLAIARQWNAKVNRKR